MQGECKNLRIHFVKNAELFAFSTTRPYLDLEDFIISLCQKKGAYQMIEAFQ